ncbi:MAG: biotin transporter BioY [Clostridiales bacterium]|nr:biotin transporter BioY [Clostridiales bacterium]
MRANATRQLTLSALLCALCAVLSQIQIPIPPVPVSLSLLGVHLCGTLLGARRGAAAVGCYVALGALGLPVFSGFAGGVSVLFGPTGGFLFGYILCAGIVGAAAQRFGFRRRTLLLSMALGTLLCYISGMAWFMLVTGTDLAGSLTACVFPFIPGDLFKILLAVLLCRRLQKPLRSMGLCV